MKAYVVYESLRMIVDDFGPLTWICTMPFKAKFAPVFIFAAIAISAVTGFAGPQIQQERVAASYMLVLGRAPSTSEVDQWTMKGELSVADLVADLEAELADSKSEKRGVSTRSFQDAFGRSPSKSELKTAVAEGGSYNQQLTGYIAALLEDAEEYEATIRRAYEFVINRDAYEQEIGYWKERGVFSYMLLVGSVEAWATRNQPGLMVTAGTPTISVNSVYLSTVRLSSQTAAEARVAGGFASVEETESHLLAAGSGKVVAGGRVHFLATGGSSRSN